MATIQKNVSKKTGQVINFKWTALIGRDEHNKQIRLTKRVEPYGLTPAREWDAQMTAAKAWEAKERAEYEKIHGASAEERIKARKERENITVCDFIEKRWLPKHVKDGKHTPSTISFFTYMGNDIKDYFTEHSPELKLSEIGKEDILDYLHWMRTEARTKRGKPYEASTIQHHFSTLRNILEYAVYIDYLKDDPCKRIKPEDRPKRKAREIDFMDSEEALRFMECLDSDQEKQYWEANNGSHTEWKALVTTLILTGLRRGELVGLQWGDLDQKAMVINVRRNVTIDTTNKEDSDPVKKVHIGLPKNGQIRTVPISKSLCDLLLELKREQRAKYGGITMPNAYIFCRAENPYLPLYPTEPTRLMRKYVLRHKLKDMSPHDLRHTSASLAIESGAGAKEIQALLGHSDPAISLKFYAAITEKAQRRTVEGIERLIMPKKEADEKAQ